MPQVVYGDTDSIVLVEDDDDMPELEDTSRGYQHPKPPRSLDFDGMYPSTIVTVIHATFGARPNPDLGRDVPREPLN